MAKNTLSKAVAKAAAKGAKQAAKQATKKTNNKTKSSGKSTKPEKKSLKDTLEQSSNKGKSLAKQGKGIKLPGNEGKDKSAKLNRNLFGEEKSFSSFSSNNDKKIFLPGGKIENKLTKSAKNRLAQREEEKQKAKDRKNWLSDNVTKEQEDKYAFKNENITNRPALRGTDYVRKEDERINKLRDDDIKLETGQKRADDLYDIQKKYDNGEIDKDAFERSVNSINFRDRSTAEKQLDSELNSLSEKYKAGEIDYDTYESSYTSAIKKYERTAEQNSKDAAEGIMAAWGKSRSEVENAIKSAGLATEEGLSNFVNGIVSGGLSTYAYQVSPDSKGGATAQGRTGRALKYGETNYMGMTKDEVYRSKYQNRQLALDIMDYAQNNKLARITRDIQTTRGLMDATVKGTNKSVNDIISQTAMNIPAMAISMVQPNIGLGLFGISAMGMSAMSAYDSGATIEDAVNYGMLSGALEVATEKLFPAVGGAYGKALSSQLWHGLVGKATKGKAYSLLTQDVREALINGGFANSVSGKVLKGVLEGGGEATEEMIAEIIDPYLQRATFNPDAQSANWQEIMDAGLMGLAVSAVLGVPVNAMNINQQIKYNNTIKELQSISELDAWAQREQTKLFVDLSRKLEKGKISEVQLQEQYAYGVLKLQKKYNDIASQRGFIKANTLKTENKVDTEDQIVEAEDIFNTANTLAKGMNDGEKVSFIANKNGTYVRETYTVQNGKVDVNSNTETVLTGAEGKRAEQRYADMQNTSNVARSSGARYGVADDIIKQAEMVQDRSGVKVHFVDGETGVNGYEQNGEIYISKNSKNAAAQILSHEFTHLLKTGNSKAYNELTDAVKDFYGDSYNEYAKQIETGYKADGINLTEEGLDDEVIAHFVEQKLLTNNQAIVRFTDTSRAASEKVIDFLNDTIIKTVGNKEQRKLVELRKKWQQAYADTVKNDGNRENKNTSNEVRNDDERFDMNKANIRYSKDITEDDVSYEAIKAKGSVMFTPVVLNDNVHDGKRTDTVILDNLAYRNVLNLDNPLNSSSQIFVYINDIGDNVLVNRRGIHHGNMHRVVFNHPRAYVYPYLGEILEKSVIVNVIDRRENDPENVIFSYVLMGLARNDDGKFAIVRSIVSVSDIDISTVKVIEVNDKFNGLSVMWDKQEKKTHQQRKGFTSKDAEPLTFDESLSVSIEDFLNLVKSTYPGDLSKDVLRHLGMDENTETDLEGKRFSLDDNMPFFENQGRGYSGYSMSNNAVAAYENGEMPISKWTKTAIMDYVKSYAEDNDINFDIAVLKKAPLSIVKNLVLEKTSYHHTSEYYNKTDFYAVNDDVLDELTNEKINRAILNAEKKPVVNTKTYKGDIEYIEWTGTKNHPKANERKLENVNIEEKGSFYIITDDNGNQLLRKKIGSNGTRVISNEEKKRRADAEAEQKRIADERESNLRNNSSPEALAFYDSLEFKNRSSSGHIYAPGRKPSRWEYENGLDKFFKKGENRLTQDNDGTLHLETWDGTKWVQETDRRLSLDINTLNNLRSDVSEKSKSVTRAKSEYDKLINSTEYQNLYQNFIEHFSSAPEEEKERLLKEISNYENISGITDAKKVYDYAEVSYRESIRTLERYEEEYRNQSLIEYRKQYSDEFNSKIATKAARHFGITTNLNLAGYLSYNGSFIKLSYMGTMRDMDHRDIGDILDFPFEPNYSDSLIEFMNMGNIRLQNYGIDLSVKPNSKQRKPLADFIDSTVRREGEFYIDFSDENGNTVDSISYDYEVPANKVLKDIDIFFDTGKKPYASEFSRFYSIDLAINELVESGQIENEGNIDVRYSIDYAEGNKAPDLTIVNGNEVKYVGDKPADYEPSKIGYAYKLMEQWPDGSLHALFAGTQSAIPVGEWIYAKGYLPEEQIGKMAKGLAPRYGWHMGTGGPATHHLMGVGNTLNPQKIYPTKSESGHPKGSKRVWVEVVYDASNEYNDIADQTTTGDIRGLIPFGGYYSFQEGNLSLWILSSAIKFNRVLEENERQQILKDKGIDEDEMWRTRTLPPKLKSRMTSAVKSLIKAQQINDTEKVKKEKDTLNRLNELYRQYNIPKEYDKKKKSVAEQIIYNSYGFTEQKAEPKSKLTPEEVVALRDEIRGGIVENEDRRFSIEQGSEWQRFFDGESDRRLSLDADYLSAVERGDIETAQRMVDEAAREAGYTIRAYHGTKRADRVGTVFRPDRATSGPMAFFTDNYEIAENYSNDKNDTSIAYDSDYDSYETQFRAKSSKYNLDMPLYKAWGYIPMAERNEIKRKAGQLRYDWDNGDYDTLILDENNVSGTGGFVHNLEYSRGNAIRALVDEWLNSANLMNEEERFFDVLNLTGVTDSLKKVGFDIEYKNPNYEERKVYDTYLKITKPFDTETVNEDFVRGFEDWYDEQDFDAYRRETANTDLWDKNNVSADEFAERMRNDLENGFTHAWTSIPDSMTDYLKSLGYDGIKDKGGKHGGQPHTVWIPFASEQVKSADPVTYDDNGNVIPLSERFDSSKDDIRYSRDDVILGKLNYAYRRNQKIKDDVDTLTPEQHDAMATIAGFRHSWHSGYSDIFKDNYEGKELIKYLGYLINREDDFANLPDVKDNPLDNIVFDEDAYPYDDYTDSPFSLRESAEWNDLEEDVPEDYDDLDWEEQQVIYDAYMADLMGKAYHYYDAIHRQIELYLSAVDKEYGTWYSPTGHARAQYSGLEDRRFSRDVFTYEQTEDDPLGWGTEDVTVPFTEVDVEQDILDSTDRMRDEEPDYFDTYSNRKKKKSRFKITLPGRDKMNERRDEQIDEWFAFEDSNIPDTGDIDYSPAEHLTGKGVTESKDYARNFDAAADGSKFLRNWLQNMFVRPFEKAKALYVKAVKKKTDDMYSYIVEELDIKKGTKESSAVQWYGEGFYTDNQGEEHEYTLEMLKEEFPDKWEDIQEAARWFRKMYDQYLEDINNARAEIYPNPTGEVEAKIERQKTRIDGYNRNISKLKTDIAKLNDVLSAYKEDYKNAKDGTKKKDELQGKIERAEARIESKKAKITEYESKRSKAESIKKSAEDSIKNGDVLRNKRIVPRKDYFHHFQELSGGIISMGKDILSGTNFANVFNLSKNGADIDPRMEGTSEFTQPKSKFSGITLRRKGGRYTPDAIGGMLQYIQVAEYMIHIDPVIAKFRAHIKGIAEATAETRNCNDFIRWLQHWVNDLCGKTQSFDRVFQDVIGRNRIAFVRKMNSRAKANAVAGNLNSALAQFFNFPNLVGQINPVTNLKSYLEGFADLIKFIGRDKSARELVRESGFLNERYIDDCINRFDEKIMDKPKKLASWTLTVGDRYTTVLIWFVARHHAQAKGMENPVEYADDITRRSVAGRGIGEIPLMQKTLFTQVMAPFQIEVNNAWQLYKEKFKGVKTGKNAKEKAEALNGFAAIMVANFMLNTLTDLLIGRRVVFDPIYVFFEWLADMIGDDDDDEDNVGYLDLLKRETGELLSNIPYASLVVYYLFDSDWAREEFFGDYDPTRYGVGAVSVEPVISLATDIFKGGDVLDDFKSFLFTYVTPVGGKQLSRTLDGLVDMGYLPHMKFTITEDGKLKLNFSAEMKPGASYNNKDLLQFPVASFGDDVGQALLTLIFGKYTSKSGRKYLGKDYDKGLLANIFGFNNIKKGSALSERATDTFNKLVDAGADKFSVFDTLQEIRSLDTNAEKMGVLLGSDLTDDAKMGIYMGYIVTENNLESEQKKVDGILGLGLSVDDYLNIKSTYSNIRNMDADNDTKAAMFFSELGAAGYSNEEIKGINEVFKYYNMAPVNTDKAMKMLDSGLSAKTTGLITNAIGSLEITEGKKQVQTWQKVEAISNLGLSEKDTENALKLYMGDNAYLKYKDSGIKLDTYVSAMKELDKLTPEKEGGKVTDLQQLEAISKLGLDMNEEAAVFRNVADNDNTYAKFKTMAGYGVAAGDYASFKRALQDANDNNPDETKRNKSFDKEEIATALSNMGVSGQKAAVLFQSATNSKAENNPYNGGVATEWKTKYDEEKERLASLKVDVAEQTTEGAEQTSGEVDKTPPLTTYKKISSGYGMRKHPISGEYKMHHGIDFAADYGTPALATMSGVVTRVQKSSSGYGNNVMFKDANGYYHLYAHLSSINVNEGDTVVAGQKVGGVGSTGASTGNHLHYEVRKPDGTTSVDPNSYEDLDGDGTLTVDTGVVYSGGGSSYSGGSRKSSGGTRKSTRKTNSTDNTQWASTGVLPGGNFQTSGTYTSTASASVTPTGRGRASASYGTAGITLPRANSNTLPRAVSNSLANRRTGRTGTSWS